MQPTYGAAGRAGHDEVPEPPLLGLFQRLQPHARSQSTFEYVFDDIDDSSRETETALVTWNPDAQAELFTLRQCSAKVQQQPLRGEIVNGKRLDIFSLDGHIVEVAGNARQLAGFITVGLGVLYESLDEQELGIVF